MRVLAASLLSSLLLLGAAPGAARPDSILVFAAASTGPAIEEAARRYRAAGNPRVRVSAAASSTLARQIANRAPADIFLSANTAWMDHLEERGALLAGSRIDLLANRLALVAPAERPVALAIAPGFALRAALRGGRLAIADPDHVPAGLYAKAALTALGVWHGIADRLARTVDARATVALVARGEAPLGIAYASDALGEPGIAMVAPFPARTHPPIVYPLALIAAGRTAPARRFARFLAAAPARAIFRRHGFVPLPRR